MIKFFQILLYLLIQILFIPLIIIGLAIAIYKEFYIGKKLGISFSAIKALQFRWFMHYFGTREDLNSVKFIEHLPCESHFGLWSLMGGLLLSNKLFGFKTKLNRVVKEGYENLDTTASRRIIYFDKIVEKYIDEVDQIVLPGAGFDLICLKYINHNNIKVYELDQSDTINIKINTIKKVGLESSRICYIPVDYDRESWSEKLLESGFDRSKKTLFLWQSVSLFLDRDIAIDSLIKMKDLSGKGSIIAQDLYSERFRSGEYSRTVKQFFHFIKKMGEVPKFGIDLGDDPKSDIKKFLNQSGLKLTNYIQFGDKLDIEPFYFIVESRVE